MNSCFKEVKHPDMLKTGIEFFHQQSMPNTVAAHSHVHDAVEMLFITDGDFCVSCDGVEERVRHGDMVLFRSNCIHTVTSGSDGNNGYYVLKVDPALVFSLMPEHGAGRYILYLTLFGESDKFVWRAGELAGTRIDDGFGVLKDECEGDAKPAHEALMRSAAFLVICGIIRTLEGLGERRIDVPASVYVLIYESMRYVNEHFAEDVSAEWMASYLNISYSYFSRTFTRVTCKNFRKYLNLVRVRKAEQLLLSRKRSVTEVSSLVGFNNVSHFIATYKSIKGNTPHKQRC